MLAKDLWYMLVVQIVYEYYLSWNTIILFFRALQLVKPCNRQQDLLTHTSFQFILLKTSPSTVEKTNYFRFLVLSNIIVFAFHFVPLRHPITLNFIGSCTDYFDLCLLSLLFSLVEKGSILSVLIANLLIAVIQMVLQKLHFSLNVSPILRSAFSNRWASTRPLLT